MARAIEGVLAPMLTPFDASGEVDLAAAARNAELMNATALAGYFYLGSNGEAAMLSDEEQLSFLRAVSRVAAPEKLFVAGISRQSAHAAIEFGLRAQEVGADYLSVLTPSYFASAMSDAALVDYFAAVADALDTPILLYNAPKFAAGVKLSYDAVRQLSRHPNIAGMKDTSSEPIEGYLDSISDSFMVVAGTVNKIAAALRRGSRGGVLSVADYLPADAQRVVDMYLSGRCDEALALAESLVRLNRAVSGSHGVAGVKCAAGLMGFAAGHVRLPLHDCDSAAAESIRAALAAHGAL